MNHWAAAFWVGVSVVCAGAQTTGSLRGVVRDSTGSVIEDAVLSARHIETGATRTLNTDGDGTFLFPSLSAGGYEIRVSKTGFRTLLRRGVTLSVGENASLELVLEVGPVDQEVTVTAQAPPVNTQTSELSYLVGQKAIEELPLNGRNYTDLALLQPGVVAFPHRDGGSVVAAGLGTSINGADPRSNVYLIDGTPQNNFTNGPAGSAAGTALGMDTIREFRVEVNAYSAEFGRNFGGHITVLTKSGSNDWRGTLFHYLRNDNFDARNFFDPARRPEFKRNQFGGSLGGPIRRDRTFFFFGYEGLQERLGRTIASFVPDEGARRGELPGLANRIAIDPLVRPYLDEFPLPNGPSIGGGVASYNWGFNQSIRQSFLQGRIDHNVSADGQLFVRYTFDDADQELPTDFPQFPRTFLSRNQFATAEYRHVLSPRALSTSRLSFSRTRVGQTVQANVSRPLTPFNPRQSIIGNIDIGGLPRFGPQSSVYVTLTQNVYGGEQNVVMTRGRHSLKVGGSLDRYQDNMVNPTFALGIYTFANLADFLQNRAQRFVGLGPDGALDRYWRFSLVGLYAQDDVRVSRRLTLNLGFRYEFSTMPVDIYGRDSALINLTDPRPTPGPLYRNPTYRNLSPRVGFAWDVLGDGKMSLRGGAGLFFNTNNQQNLIVTVTNPPATPRLVINNPTFPNPPFDRGIGNSMRPVEWNLKNPYAVIWNLNVQRQLWSDAVVTVGYAGSRGIHLLRSTDINTPQPERLADGTLFFAANLPRPNPAFGTIELKRSDGNSWYNALLVEVRKRFGAGFTAQSSYTFSRTIDTTQASTFFSDATNGTTSAMPEFPGFNYNKGLADFHAKHNWVGNLVWEIPLGKSLNGWRRQAVAGWQWASIWQARSGNPLTVFVSRNRSRSQWSPSLGPGIGQDRASLAPGRTHESAVLGRPERYFDPTAFVLPAAGTLGTLGRGTFIGPNLRNLDLAAMKAFTVSDRFRLQFRMEVFNAGNRTNFGVPANPGLLAFAGAADNEAPLASFGRIRNTVTSARQIQFSLRLSF